MIVLVTCGVLIRALIYASNGQANLVGLLIFRSCISILGWHLTRLIDGSIFHSRAGRNLGISFLWTLKYLFRAFLVHAVVARFLPRRRCAIVVLIWADLLIVLLAVDLLRGQDVLVCHLVVVLTLLLCFSSAAIFPSFIVSMVYGVSFDLPFI